MEVRPYTANDLAACLRLFDSNRPQYFTADERGQFEAFLEPGLGSYYVLENEGDLLGCGGFTAGQEAGLVSLTWGIVRHDLHGSGLGKFLLFYRLREIGKLAGITMVRLETAPQTAGFFEKAGGFRVMKHEPDGYGPGLDRVTMVKRLAVCT